jgi:hypothetical protein
LISQVVDAILSAVAVPYWASVLEPVDPVAARYIVSDVIAIVTALDDIFTNVIAVPTGYATLALLSIVNVLAFVSVDG